MVVFGPVMRNSFIFIKLRQDQSGGVAIGMSLVLLLLLGCIGLAVDVGLSYRTKTRVQGAADAAALAGAVAAKNFVAGQSSQSQDILTEAESIAQSAAQKIFSADTSIVQVFKPSATINLDLSGGAVQSNVTYSVNVKSFFAGLFGRKSFLVAGQASAIVSMPKYIEVHLLIDTSGSMAIGASAADQNALISATGCAFACHDGSPVNGYADAYAFAMANGITLRYTAINSGILSLMNKIDTIDPGHQFINVAVYSFNNNVTNNAALTTNTGVIRANLPTAPATSSTTAGATHFNEIIGQVVNSIGNGGSGNSASDPIKLIIIATDGAQDPGRYWTTDIPARDFVGPFDMSFCDGLKANNVNVGIIHTPYLPMTYDWGFMATLGQPSRIGGLGMRYEDIPIVLKACAGTNYVLADDTSQIVNAFVKLFDGLSVARIAR